MSPHSLKERLLGSCISQNRKATREPLEMNSSEGKLWNSRRSSPRTACACTSTVRGWVGDITCSCTPSMRSSSSSSSCYTSTASIFWFTVTPATVCASYLRFHTRGATLHSGRAPLAPPCWRPGSLLSVSSRRWGDLVYYWLKVQDSCHSDVRWQIVAGKYPLNQLPQLSGDQQNQPVLWIPPAVVWIIRYYEVWLDCLGENFPATGYRRQLFGVCGKVYLYCYIFEFVASFMAVTMYLMEKFMKSLVQSISWRSRRSSSSRHSAL